MPFGLSAVAAKAIGVLMLLATLSGLIFGAIKHYEAVGERKAKAEQEAADAAWMKGANENMGKVQEGFAAVVQTLNDERQKNAAFQAESDRLSAANDRRPAFDAAAVARLQRAGAKPQGPR
jgi:hypothetical protein